MIAAIHVRVPRTLEHQIARNLEEDITQEQNSGAVAVDGCREPESSFHVRRQSRHSPVDVVEEIKEHMSGISR